MENVSPHKRVKGSLRLGCARVGMIFTVVRLDNKYPLRPPIFLLPSFLNIFARVGGLGFFSDFFPIFF